MRKLHTYRVTLPNGRTYDYSRYRRDAAYGLAKRTGGTVDYYGTSQAVAARYVCGCSVPGCQGCDDIMDSRRDAYRTGR
jgi:hypothetical protein